MLGKRTRGPMKRTTSMSGINVEESGPSDHAHFNTVLINGQDLPMIHAVEEIAEFLKTCGLCKSRLVPSQDKYMYRGDTAFCSEECRDQQIKRDENKDKYSSLISSQQDENRHQRHHPTMVTPSKSTEPCN